MIFQEIFCLFSNPTLAKFLTSQAFCFIIVATSSQPTNGNLLNLWPIFLWLSKCKMLLKKLQEYLAIIAEELKCVNVKFVSTRKKTLADHKCWSASNICLSYSSSVMVFWQPCGVFTKINPVLELPATTYIFNWDIYYFRDKIQNIFIDSHASFCLLPTYTPHFSLSAIILYHFSSFIN